MVHDLYKYINGRTFYNNTVTRAVSWQLAVRAYLHIHPLFLHGEDGVDGLVDDSQRLLPPLHLLSERLHEPAPRHT